MPGLDFAHINDIIKVSNTGWSDFVKISILGDIMCEPSVLNGAKTKNGYDFNPMFKEVSPLLSQADYVIANFESPLAGKAAGYTHSYYVFNAPDEYAKAVKNAGIDLVSTANNHTFDRGMAGLIRTLEVLDRCGVAHTGTYAPGTERKGAHYFEVDGTRFALVAYTYSTNWDDGENDPRDVICEGEYEGTVNLLLNQKASVYLPGVWRGDDKIDKFFKKWIPDEEKRGRIKAWLGKENNYARADDNLKPEEMTPYIEALTSDIKDAKQNADVVIAYPHVGGQFNEKPGAITRYVVDKCIEAGADAVMAGHAHCIHKAEIKEGVPCAYSLGNFSMSPNSSLILKERLPAFGLCVHLYVEDKKIVKTTFSILKAVEKKGKLLVSYPVDVLYDSLKSKKAKVKLLEEVKTIYKTVKGHYPKSNIIKKEYDL